MRPAGLHTAAAAVEPRHTFLTCCTPTDTQPALTLGNKRLVLLNNRTRLYVVCLGHGSVCVFWSGRTLSIRSTCDRVSSVTTRSSFTYTVLVGLTMPHLLGWLVDASSACFFLKRSFISSTGTFCTSCRTVTNTFTLMPQDIILAQRP